MGAEIKDEFSQLPISRQRKYYLRQRRDRRCTKCGKPVERGSLCLEHMVQLREYRRKTFNLKRRYRGSFSYQAEAAQVADSAPAIVPTSPAVLAGVNGKASAPISISTAAVQVTKPVPFDPGVPENHPLRAVKARVDQLLENAAHSLDNLDTRSGISPKAVLKAWVLMNLYAVRSPKLFCEQLGYNLLWLWFLDRSMAQGGFDPAAFEQAYDRVLTTEPARHFFTQVFSNSTN
jgi:transposase